MNLPKGRRSMDPMPWDVCIVAGFLLANIDEYKTDHKIINQTTWENHCSSGCMSIQTKGMLGNVTKRLRHLWIIFLMNNVVALGCNRLLVPVEEQWRFCSLTEKAMHNEAIQPRSNSHALINRTNSIRKLKLETKMRKISAINLYFVSGIFSERGSKGRTFKINLIHTWC